MTESDCDHLRAVSRVYGPETWEVYDLLDRSLDPRGPEMMLALGIERLTPASRVLDVGCRDGSHLIELVRTSGANGVGLDPLSHLLERAHRAVVEAGLEERVVLVERVMQQIPFPDASFDLVWCRDVIEIVDDLDAGVVEMARVLRPGAQLIVFTVVATDRLEPRERRMLTEQSMALLGDNLMPQRIKDSFRKAGLAMVVEDEIGTEWREYSEERRQTTSHELLQLARLRRQRDRIIEQAGEDIYAHIEANLHWLVYQFLGKLLPTIYVLRKPD